MKIKYECEFCGTLYDSSRECMDHEREHLSDKDKIVYDIHVLIREDVCDYCTESYYVYGCEKDCKHKDCSPINYFKYFNPVEPLHNKRSNGGV